MKLIITESKLYSVIDSYLTKTIKGLDEVLSNHGGHGRFDFKDKTGAPQVCIFFNRNSQDMEVMMVDSLYGEIYSMFSRNGFDDIEEHLIRWFQENFDGLGDIKEIFTFDNDNYDY